MSTFLLPIFLDIAIKGLAILLLTTIATLAMRRASASARHLVWFLASISLLILPILSTALPGWYILPRWAMNDVVSPSPQPSPAPIIIPQIPAASDTHLLPNYTLPLPKIDLPPVATPILSPIPPALPAAAPSPVHLSWQAWVLLIWLAGSALLLTNIALGFLSLWLLRRRSALISEGDLTRLLGQLCNQLNFHRPIDLLSCPHRTMPMTWGLWRTRILLPEDSTTWTDEQRRAVLLHELAHAKRWDCLTQFLTQIAAALHWFNPLIWLAWRKMQTEREQACDDLVLSTGTKASAYAEQLLHIASEMRTTRYSAAAIAMARPSTLEGRLLAILDLKRNRRRLTAGAVVLVSAAMAISLVFMAVLRADNTPLSPALQAVSNWTSQHGWNAQTVTTTDLEGLGGGWRNLPFSLSKEEEADARACIKLVEKTHTYYNNKSEFSDPSTRDALETILAKSPNYFYAEFLLARWEHDFGDAQKAANLLDAAYQHAPTIIVQRYEFQDGSPVANTPIQSFALECNTVQKGYLDNFQLQYYELRTDADGCIYLPVYNTVYRTNNMASPAGYAVKFPTLGWFETSRKVGMLPVAIVTPEPGDFTPSTSPTDAPSTSAILPDNNAVELLAISPYPDPKNIWWLPDGSPSTRQYQTGDPGASPWPDENGCRFIFHFANALPEDARVQFKFSVPAVGQIHYATVRNQDLEKPYVLFTHFPTHPKKVSLRLGEASGPWKSLADYDPRSHKTTGDLPNGCIFKDAQDKNDDSTEVVVENPPTDLDLRAVAVGIDGKEHTTNRTSFSESSTASGTTIDNGYGFEHFPLNNIKLFRLEYRKYQWVEFSNISLDPDDGRSKLTPSPAAAQAGIYTVHAARTAPTFDHGAWNMPVIGYVRNRVPNAAWRPGPWFAIANSDLTESVQVNLLTLGLSADAPINEITERITGGDLYEPELGLIEPIRGTLMAPMNLPADTTVVEPIAFERGVATMTCEEIAQLVISYHRAHPQVLQWHLKDGEHFAVLRVDGGLSAMDVHGNGEQMYVTIIPIGMVRMPAADQSPAGQPGEATPATQPNRGGAAGLSAGAGIDVPTALATQPATVPATQAKGATLDFRIAAEVGDETGKPAGNILSRELAQQYITDLATNGPQGGPARIKGFGWFELGDTDTAPPFAITGTSAGKKYVLLMSIEPYAMLAERQGKRTWGIQRAYVTKDNNSQTAIGFDFDAPGAQKFGQLTEANLHHLLGVLIDDKVVVLATIQSKIIGSGIIARSNGFDPAEAQKIADSLTEGMPPATQPTATQAAAEILFFAPFDGVIMRVGKKTGDGAKKGEPLFSLDTSELIIRRESARAQAEADRVVAAKYRSIDMLDESNAALASQAHFKEEVNRYQQLIDLAVVNAPCDCQVVESKLDDKVYVSVKQGDKLMVIAPNDKSN